MVLPQSAIILINEYSKPLTHPNWKNRHWICVGELYKDIYRNKLYLQSKLYKQFLYNVQHEIPPHILHNEMIFKGSKYVSNTYGIKLKVLYDIIYKN
jgi:hypothetical protein